MKPLRSFLLAGVATLGVALSLHAVGCIAASPEEPPLPEKPAGDGVDASLQVDVGGDVKLELPTQDPHGVLGCDPPHGPWTGGQRTLVHGSGLSSKTRVWFGATEIDPLKLLAIDPKKLQAEVPAGAPGPVDVTVQEGDDPSTKRTLAAAYYYDEFYALPSEGPTSGGTVIQILGSGMAWDDATMARVGQTECTLLTVLSKNELLCTAPAGTPGWKAISVTSQGETITVLDAFRYVDSDNGYKGGLSGKPLAGHLKVLALDSLFGEPIPDAYAIVGTDIDSALIEQTDGKGLATLTDPSLVGKQTVTVTARCFGAISYVDVEVDTVTAYLDGMMIPACLGEGDPPLSGAKPDAFGTLEGELVWPGGVEWKKGTWDNVPEPVDPNEKRVAYVFLADADPTRAFVLPDVSLAIYEDTPGSIGYQFTLPVDFPYYQPKPGNRAVYALAGIENRAVVPPKFTAYIFGAVKGVPSAPGEVTKNVYISMASPLDQVITMSVFPPDPGPMGPDRLRATVAIRLGNDGYAILPIGQKTIPVPASGDLKFIGVPALAGELAGNQFLSTGRAGTGPNLNVPMSIILRQLTLSPAQKVVMDGFVNVPEIVTPGVNHTWDATSLAAKFQPGAWPVDMTVYNVLSAGGVARWQVVVPGGTNAVVVPDLRGFPDQGPQPGPITTWIYGLRLEKFNYQNIRQPLYRGRLPADTLAYSVSFFHAHL